MEKVDAQRNLMLIGLQSSEAVNLAGVGIPHRAANIDQKHAWQAFLRCMDKHAKGTLQQSFVEG